MVDYIELAEELLDMYPSLEDLFESNDLTVEDVVARLIEIGLIEVPQEVMILDS